MNVFSAEDINAAAASAHNTGYQAGYADAVQAYELGKPAAAQEAVAVVDGPDRGASISSTATLIRALPSGTKLFAAPVAAAPVDLIERCKEIIAWQKTGVLTGNALRAYADARWPDEHAKLQIAENETAREAYRILSVATATSTPAAPGIDLAEMVKSNLRSIKSLARVLPISHVSAANIVCEADHAIALIDASPKGGSTDAQDAARWRVAREQNGVTISVEEADDDGDMHFVSGHTPEELDAAMDALQATSVEVGA